jgi:hypothetical protein
MKKFIKPYKFVYSLLFILSSFTAFATPNDPEVEKRKTIAKNYPVNSSDKLVLDNQFGEVKITTWDRSEVKIEVTIIATSDNESRAQEMLDRIIITEGKSGNTVSVKTKMNESKKNWNGHRNEKFEINYAISMPATLALDLTHQFGNSYVPDLKGPVDIEQKFGNLYAGKLSKVQNISVEFGKATIESINGGSVVVKFSKAAINNIEGSIKGNFEHCGGIKLNITNAVTGLTLRNEFSQIYLDVATNLNATYDVYTNFSELKNKSSFKITEDKEDDDRRGPKFDHQYNGKSGTGNINIKVKANFGDVIIGHNLPFDVNAEDKKEKKKKTTSI